MVQEMYGSVKLRRNNKSKCLNNEGKAAIKKKEAAWNGVFG